MKIVRSRVTFLCFFSFFRSFFFPFSIELESAFLPPAFSFHLYFIFLGNSDSTQVPSPHPHCPLSASFFRPLASSDDIPMPFFYLFSPSLIFPFLKENSPSCIASSLFQVAATRSIWYVLTAVCLSLIIYLFIEFYFYLFLSWFYCLYMCS